MLPSGIENAILTSMNLDGAFSQFNIQIAHDSETEPCFLQAMCSNYLSNADCLDQGLGLMKNLDLSLDLTQYGTTIAYKCPPGQRFVDNSTSQILSCGWKKQWQPSNQLLGCEGKCFDVSCTYVYALTLSNGQRKIIILTLACL